MIAHLILCRCEINETYKVVNNELRKEKALGFASIVNLNIAT